MKAALIVVAAFVLLYVLNQPEEAGQKTNQVVGQASDGADSATTFVSSLSGQTIGALLLLGAAALIVKAFKK